MTIFLMLNGVGVVFLLYVLAKFWKEGHRSGNDGLRYTSDFGRQDSADVLVIAQPIYRAAQGGISVIPFQARSQEPNSRQDGNAGGREATETPVRRVSAR
jgi:hypothetical protein